MTAAKGYVHGYSARESVRLADQAETLTELLHHDTGYPAGCDVLEVGCGVGAQTVILAERSPDARIVSMDISAASVAAAKDRLTRTPYRNVTFQVADLFASPFAKQSFDHIFVCFVLEHLPDPAAALAALRPMLREGGTITVIEGDHGLTAFWPKSESADRAIACQVRLQAKAGGDAMIGRRVYPLLVEAGFGEVNVSPRMVYVDASRPKLVEGFTKNTFTAMIEGVRESAVAEKLMSAEEFDRGVRDLHRTCENDGVFCYTFFKGRAKK